MASINKKVPSEPVYTNTGSPAMKISLEKELRRTVMSCLLWEDSFYEDGFSIAERITQLVTQLPSSFVIELALEASDNMNLRHVPLLLMREVVRKQEKDVVYYDALAHILSKRADQLTEFISLYWQDGKVPLPKQVRKAVNIAFNSFNEYQLAKYKAKNKAVSLRDVMFLTHPMPMWKKDKNRQEQMFKNLADNSLPIPNTWETRLSSGEDKKSVWTDLLTNNELGALALLRNLRNMEVVGVSSSLIKEALENADYSKVFPFRFFAAAKNAPRYESIIDSVFIDRLKQLPKLKGKTVLVIDVSGSMYHAPVSEKSDMDRAIAACSLAAIMRERCEDVAIYATAGDDGTRVHKTQLVPDRHGIALVDAIYNMCNPLGGGGIFLTPVCKYLSDLEKDVDRMIVITDEQDCAGDGSNSPLRANPLGTPENNFLINVASYQRGIGYGKWTHLDGFSEAVVDYIIESSKN